MRNACKTSTLINVTKELLFTYCGGGFGGDGDGCGDGGGDGGGHGGGNGGDGDGDDERRVKPVQFKT